MSNKKSTFIDLTAVVYKLINNPDNVKQVYSISVKDLIASMIDTNNINVIFIL
jgi:hypothetical protein